MPPWVADYLDLLRLAPEPPSLAFLERLLYAHLHRVPFENISKLYYYRRLAHLGWKVPPPAVWVENIRTRDFGGTCFTINGALHGLLTALGYEARLMRAGGGSHVAAGVKLGGRLYLTDPALGAPLFKPVDLSAPAMAERFGRGVRLSPMDGEPGAFYLDHYLDGERKMSWTLTTMPEPIDQFIPNVDYSYSPRGFFMTVLTCFFYQENPRRHLALHNNRFTVRRPDGSKTMTELQSLEALEAVVAQEFRLPGLPVREAVETLETLGVDIFAAPQQ